MSRLSMLLLPILALAAPAAGPLALTGPSDGGIKIGQKVHFLAESRLKSTTGQEFSFKDLLPAKKGEEVAAGSVFVLDFWSCHCPWSRAWDAALNSIAKDYAEKGVKVVALSGNPQEVYDEKGLEGTNAYIKENELAFPVLCDLDNRLADQFGALTTPHIFLVDQKGTVIYTGAVDNDAHNRLEADARKDYLRDALDAHLAGKEIEVKETRPKGCNIKGKRNIRT